VWCDVVVVAAVVVAVAAPWSLEKALWWEFFRNPGPKSLQDLRFVYKVYKPCKTCDSFTRLICTSSTPLRYVTQESVRSKPPT